MKRLNIPRERTFVGPALIWKRIAAFFIDMAIINLIVLFPFRKLFEDRFPNNYSFSEMYGIFSSSADYTRFASSVLFAVSLIIFLYFFMLERKMGQSIGKMLMKIYVTSDNNAPKSWQILVRNLEFISIIPLFSFTLLWLFDPLSMFFTKTNQRLTEILSKTKTVEKFSIHD